MSESHPASPPPARPWGWQVAIGSAALLLLVTGLLIVTSRGEPKPLGLNPMGERAPEFSLPDLNGTTHALSAHRGHNVVLTFWASWCHVCKRVAPTLAAADAQWGDDVQFIGVDEEDTIRDGRAFVEDARIRYPNIFDPEGLVGRAYGVFAHPETFFIAPDGRIRAKWMGEFDAARLNGFVHYLLEHSPAPP